MRSTAAVAVGLATLSIAADCTAGTQNDPPVPDDEVLTREMDDALALLDRSPLEGFDPPGQPLTGASTQRRPRW